MKRACMHVCTQYGFHAISFSMHAWCYCVTRHVAANNYTWKASFMRCACIYSFKSLKAKWNGSICSEGCFLAVLWHVNVKFAAAIGNIIFNITTVMKSQLEIFFTPMKYAKIPETFFFVFLRTKWNRKVSDLFFVCIKMTKKTKLAKSQKILKDSIYHSWTIIPGNTIYE